ncbi:unnamed protein product, partial [Meganyctiphanes norvegica]
MKVKRYKKAQRVLSFFQHNFDLKPPYKVLLDGTFCHAALDGKVNVKEQIPKYLGADTTIYSTQCIIMEVEKLSKMVSNIYGAWLIVKQFPVHRCGHEGRPMPAAACIKSILKKNNPHQYIMATQDDDIRQHIHSLVIGTPIVYLSGSAPTLEKPTAKCEAIAVEGKKCLSTHELTTLKDLKRKILGEEEAAPPIKKKKKAKNPNPLSCKKKQKKSNITQPPNKDHESGKRKRKRNKKKMGGLSINHNALANSS